MVEASIPQKQCVKKDKCINPLGNLLPATGEYFHRDKSKRDGLCTTCKVCKCATSKQWAADNPERAAANSATWKAENPDKVAASRERNRENDRARSKKRYQEHPEKYQQYRAEHAEEIAAAKRKYRQEHPEETKRHKSESQKRNRPAANERMRRHNERHPARRKARSAVSNAIQLGKLQPASELVCATCGKPAREYHHESYEQEHWLNVIPLCHECHVETRK